jgi:hypothetical protein
MVGIAHAYVVPVAIVPVGVYEKVTAVHVEVLCDTMIGVGLTVMVTVNTVPVVQEPDVGVTT